jgi:hypothetical protein
VLWSARGSTPVTENVRQDSGDRVATVARTDAPRSKGG